MQKCAEALCSLLHTIHHDYLIHFQFSVSALQSALLCVSTSLPVCLCAAEGAMPQLDSRCALTHCSTQATAVLPCLCVEDRVCVCVWSVCVCDVCSATLSSECPSVVSLYSSSSSLTVTCRLWRPARLPHGCPTCHFGRISWFLAKPPSFSPRGLDVS